MPFVSRHGLLDLTGSQDGLTSTIIPAILINLKSARFSAKGHLAESVPEGWGRVETER